MKYLLVVKDDLVAYTWLHPWEDADSEAATTAISNWISCFGCMDWLLQDLGSLFVASLMRNLTRSAFIRHRFTIPHCPWANGTVERLGIKTIMVHKAVLSEWNFSLLQWPSIVELMHNIINQSSVLRPGERANGRARCHVEVFTGMTPPSLLIDSSRILQFKDLPALYEAKAFEISFVGAGHQAL